MCYGKDQRVVKGIGQFVSQHSNHRSDNPTYSYAMSGCLDWRIARPLDESMGKSKPLVARGKGISFTRQLLQSLRVLGFGMSQVMVVSVGKQHWNNRRVDDRKCQRVELTISSPVDQFGFFKRGGSSGRLCALSIEESVLVFCVGAATACHSHVTDTFSCILILTCVIGLNRIAILCGDKCSY